MIIDSHMHVWDLDKAAYPWLEGARPEWNRTFTLAEVLPRLREHEISATVLVEAADNDADTAFMLDTASHHPEVVGVVAYVPLEDPDSTDRRLEQLTGDRRVVGVRNLIHHQPDPDWILRPDVIESLRLVNGAGLSLDYVSVLPAHLRNLSPLLEAVPGLRVVIDHLSKPPVGSPDLEPWKELIARAARHPNVHAKVSGLYADGAMDAWTIDDLRPIVDHALSVFAPDRLMYGGDWPISVAAGGYDRVFLGLEAVLAELSPTELHHVMSGTATRFYRIAEDLLRVAKKATSAHGG